MKSSSNNSCLDWINCICAPLPSVCLVLGVTQRLECRRCSKHLASRECRLCSKLVANASPTKRGQGSQEPNPSSEAPPSPRFPALSLQPWAPKSPSGSGSMSPRNGLKCWTRRVAVCVMPAQPPTSWAPKGKPQISLYGDLFSEESGQDLAVSVWAQCCHLPCPGAAFSEVGERLWGQDSSNTAAFSSRVLSQRNLVGMIFTFAAFFWDP